MADRQKWEYRMIEPSIADAAMNSGVARTEIDLGEYTKRLEDEADHPPE